MFIETQNNSACGVFAFDFELGRSGIGGIFNKQEKLFRIVTFRRLIFVMLAFLNKERNRDARVRGKTGWVCAQVFRKT